MAKVDLHSLGKKSAGSLDLDASVFEAPIRPHLFQAEVRRQLAKSRAGTHATKNRSAVSGGGAKPWRQKGTGRARQGSTRSPQWEGGGVVFGPVPRGYEHRLPRKVRAAALRSALSLRLSEGDLVVVDGLSLPEVKTRQVVEALRGLGLDGQPVLIVIGEADRAVELSTRNLPRVSVLRVEGLNTYDVLRHPKLLMTRDAVEKATARLSRTAEEQDR